MIGEIDSDCVTGRKELPQFVQTTIMEERCIRILRTYFTAVLAPESGGQTICLKVMVVRRVTVGITDMLADIMDDEKTRVRKGIVQRICDEGTQVGIEAGVVIESRFVTRCELETREVGMIDQRPAQISEESATPVRDELVRPIIDIVPGLAEDRRKKGGPCREHVLHDLRREVRLRDDIGEEV